MKEVKVLLLLAAVVIVIRIVLEQAAVAPGLHPVLGVTWLALLTPFVLGIQAARKGLATPIKTAAVSTVIVIVGMRFMIMITYMLAWLMDFSAFRFSVEGGGIVGEPSPLWGFLLTPLLTFLGSAVFMGVIAALLAAITAAVAARLVFGPAAA